jgi:glutamate-ammonia-ligase adenylyltransferase
MADDRQTHSIPGDPQEIDDVARLHGLENGAALLALLEPSVTRTAPCQGRLSGSGRRSAADRKLAFGKGANASHGRGA